MDQPGKVANSARGQLNRKNQCFPSAFAPENLVSRDGFSSPVPRQPAHLHTQAESGPYLQDSSRVPRRRPFIILNRHTSSDHSRVYRVTQLRTDGVHSRESAGTGPVNLKVVILNRHTSPGQSRCYRVTQLRTDGVHSRESAGTGPVNLKVVPNE